MRISDWSSDVCSSDLHLAGIGVDRHLVRIVLADDHVAGERVAVVHEAVPGLLAGRNAGVVARGHHMGLAAAAAREPALEAQEMPLLAALPVRCRTLLARRQFTDSTPVTTESAQGDGAEVPDAQGKPGPPA